jgi:hypothetical protein
MFLISHVCILYERDLKNSIEEFYKYIDSSFSVYKIADEIDSDHQNIKRSLYMLKLIKLER